MYAHLLQSCPILCSPMNNSLQSSSVHGIFPASILVWVDISYSRISSNPGTDSVVSCIVGRFFYYWATGEVSTVQQSESAIHTQISPLFWIPFSFRSPQSTVFPEIYSGRLVAKSCPTLATLWTVACQAPLSVGFSRQEYSSGLPFPSPELYNRFSLVVLFINIIHGIYMSIPVFQFIPPIPPPLVSMHLFSRSLSLFVLCKYDYLYHFFFSGSTYMCLYDICFSLSDLLHSEWRLLCPSTPLHMTQCCPLLRLSIYSIIYKYHIFFIQSSVDGYLHGFHSWLL